MQIELDKIAFRYPQSGTPVFQDLSALIPGAGFFALFGASGVGKSTLARLLAGETPPHGGEIRLQGIGRVLYSYNTEKLPGWASVGEHLTRVCPPAGLERIHHLVEAFGVESCLASRFARLSLGQQNRINLTRYLLQDFDLLIMDESLANVDELTREGIITTIKAMFPERVFLYISHSVAEVARFCREIFVLRSPRRQPQLVPVAGQDLPGGGTLDRVAHEHTMLEIVHAA
jgi:ABC-type multidrug transport system ATPase subunit